MLCRRPQDGLKALDKATDENVRQLLRNPPLQVVDDDVRSRTPLSYLRALPPRAASPALLLHESV